MGDGVTATVTTDENGNPVIRVDAGSPTAQQVTHDVLQQFSDIAKIAQQREETLSVAKDVQTNSSPMIGAAIPQKDDPSRNF